ARTRCPRLESPPARGWAPEAGWGSGSAGFALGPGGSFARLTRRSRVVKLQLDMEQFHESQFAPGQYVDPRVRLKPGVDRFMAGVFSWMTLGLLVTGAVAFLVSSSPELLALIFGTP